MFILSLTLWDINLQTISRQTEVITFLEKANSAKPGGAVLYLAPSRCLLWVGPGGAEVDRTLSSLVWRRRTSPRVPCPGAPRSSRGLPVLNGKGKDGPDSRVAQHVELQEAKKTVVLSGNATLPTER